MIQSKPVSAVALQYDESGVPRVTAKGEGDRAEMILAIARENNIPIEDNPLLAEALAQIELDEEIPPELYVAVAEVISFILRCSARTRRQEQL